MKIKNSFLFVFIIFLLFNFVKITAQRDYPKVEIDGTEVRKLFSEINNQEYVLNISLPANYGDKNKTFPTVYLLDAQWDFPLVYAIYGEQYFDGFLPELIIVGVTWGGENPDHDKLRANDFTPTNVNANYPTGNADNFIKFFEEELIPFMENNYSVSKTDRTLMGSSLGGLFSLYTIFNRHQLFNRYVFTSPAINWDNNVILNIENEFSTKINELSIKAAVFVGELEMGAEPIKEFMQKLKDRNYSGLELRSNVIDGIGHSGSKAEGYTRGLQFVFERSEIQIDDSVLNDYTGDYKLSPGDYNLKVINEEGHLVVIINSFYRIKLYADSETDFYAKSEFAKVHFEKDESGKVTGFNLQNYQSESYAKKID